MKNKICVYAICKNEEQFVDRWYESMKEADYVVVLDTGSTDNTVNKLKAHGVKVEVQEIKPWRFDVARNESLKLVPKDANILFCTDLDEVFEPGWAQILRDNWQEGKHYRGYYKYAWSHDESGNPGRVFYYDKIHDKTYKWKHPVHEFLYSEKHQDEYEHVLDLFDKIYLHHYPDSTKSRGSYLDLLKLRKEESPDDFYGRFYLAHEYCYRGLYIESIAELEDLLYNYRDKFSSVDLAAANMFIADNYRSMNNTFDALSYYLRAIQADKTFREPYLYAAELMNEQGLYKVAIAYTEEAIKNTYRHYSWLERNSSWNEQIDDILGVAYYWLGDAEKCLHHCIKASNLNPSDERLKENLRLAERLYFETRS